MKKFLLSLALVLLSGAAMAQSTINFTFTRNGENATVNVEGANGVTATIEATSPSPQSNATKTGVWNTGGNMGTDTNILCTSTNTNAATTPITYTLTINGVNNNLTFNAITFTHITANASGNYQPHTTGDIRHCNFDLTVNDSELGSKTDFDIWVQGAAGNTGKDVTFEDIEFKATEGTIVIKLSIAKGTDNKGCFYGLKEISISSPEISTPTMTEEEKAAAKAEALAIPTDIVGYPKSSAIQEFCDAVDAATYATEVVALKEAMLANVENFVMPAADKVYALDSYRDYLYNNVDGSTDLKTNGNSNTDTKALWKFIPVDGGYNIQNVHTGRYINGAVMSETPGKFTLDVVAEENGRKNAQMGQFYIKIDGGNNCIHSFDENAKSWSGAGAGNQYTFVEVNEFSHTLSVTDAGWATLVLGFNATIPANVKAYTIESEEGNYVTLAEATGVLKANVPVIVEATEGNYDFAYTTEPATVETSGLEGTLYNKNITENAYVLGNLDGEVGLAKAKLTDGAFLNNANKAYYVPSTANGITAYSFRFGGNATAIESVKSELDLNAPIYDLSGRRVKAATKGIYIQNGKKFIVK